MSLREKLILEVERFHNRDFLKATLAVCALAAFADKTVDLAERYQIDKILATEPALKRFDMDQAIETLDEYLYALRTEGQEAFDDLHAKVEKQRSHPKRARTLMRVAYQIITADDKITEAERKEFTRLCTLLGLDAKAVWAGLEQTA